MAGTLMVLGAAVGAGAGTDVAVGLSAGICTMARSAQNLGVMTPEQVDEVIAHVPTLFDGDLPEGTATAGSAAKCEETLQQLKALRAES